MDNETVLIKGNTYPVRYELRAIGGVWSASEKGWRVPAEKADLARALVERIGQISEEEAERLIAAGARRMAGK